MTDQIVVLGWDALDAALVDEFGLSGQFGAHQKRIETIVNPAIEEPHTRELWPTLITGRTPDDHGIRAATDSDGVDWGNPVLDTASSVANGIVPQPVLTAIGKRLRSRGAGLGFEKPAYYRKRGIETVFDGRGSRPISIPNYATAADRRLGLDANRDRLWKELQADRTVVEGIEPQVDIGAVEDILGRALGRRVTQTVAAMQQDTPLVWCWFGLLDSVGHMDPAVEHPLQREAYDLAAGITETVRSLAGDGTTVLSVSDHGLQAGHHTHYATVASDDAAAVEAIDSVLDVAPWIQRRDPGGRAVPSATAEQSVDETREQLEALGYV
jgi:hypothetical protein